MLTKGTLYIISAPSGGGKTSLVRAALKKVPNLIVSVSHTTRAPRPGEQNNVDYHFVTDTEFKTLITQHAFLEHAAVFGFSYGTSRHLVDEKLSQGLDVVLEIDWQGAVQIKQKMPEVISIFILPPSRAILAERLRERAQDNVQVIEKRLALAGTEIAHCGEYDYLVVNNDFNTAVEDLCSIIKAQRLRIAVQREMQAGLLKTLI